LTNSPNAINVGVGGRFLRTSSTDELSCNMQNASPICHWMVVLVFIPGYIRKIKDIPVH